MGLARQAPAGGPAVMAEVGEEALKALRQVNWRKRPPSPRTALAKAESDRLLEACKQIATHRACPVSVVLREAVREYVQRYGLGKGA